MKHYVEGECIYCDSRITVACCGEHEGTWMHAGGKVFCPGGEPFGETATAKRDSSGKVLRRDAKGTLVPFTEVTA